VLGHYARDEKLFSLAQAVRRMTTVPAAVFGLKGRGSIRTGGFADLVVFDAGAIIDAASFESPIRPSPGITLVMVNGHAVWRAGAPSGERPGRVLGREAA
jgi:N-acyl-D-amino-acid deacylase